MFSHTTAAQLSKERITKQAEGGGVGWQRLSWSLSPRFIHQTLSLRGEGIVHGAVSIDSSLGYSDRGESGGTL